MTNQKNEAGAIAPQLPPELQLRKPKHISKTQVKEVKEAFLTYLQSNFPGVSKLKFKFSICTGHIMARARYGERYLYAPAWNFQDCIRKFTHEYNTKVMHALPIG